MIQTSIAAYIVLIAARIALATLGPAMLWLQQSRNIHSASPSVLNILVMAWRQLAVTVLMLGILCACFLFPSLDARDTCAKTPSISKRQILRRICLHGFLGGLALGANNILWTYGIAHTSLASAYILGWMHPPLMVLVLVVFFGRHPSTGEKIASLTCVLGAVLLAVGPLETSSHDSSASGHPTLQGNAATFLSCFFNIPLILLAEEAGTAGGVYFILYVFVLALTSAMILGGIVAFSDPLLLLPSDDATWLFVLFVAVVPGTIGLCGPWVALSRVSPTIVSVSAPLECVFAAVLGVLMHLAPCPNAYEISGALVVVLSLACAGCSTAPPSRPPARHPGGEDRRLMDDDEATGVN